VLKVPEGDLLVRTATTLADYSQALDRNRLFRTLTLTCLLVGFPLVLFAILFSLLGSLPNLFLTVQLSDMIAAILCVLVGGLLLLPVYQGHRARVSLAESADHLSVPSSVGRIAALRQAYEERQDIAAEAKNNGLDASPNVAERYWLARSLAYAKDPLARPMLSKLANDPMPIVACQALWAMGERNNREVIHTLIERINTSSHWYVQMYTYRSLRKLGWVQPRSPQLSY
jgi:hypothetical protein